MPQFKDHMYFFEEILGPYPFRADKYGVAQTPHLGMEHQTIIAYGANFDNSAMTGFDWGFDALHHHELSHEWWGNLVTNADWKDMWLHEGIGTYMQALYMEKLQGMDGYRKYISAQHFSNVYAVAPQKSCSANEIWNGPPIYSKGAVILHTLRYLLGIEKLKKALRLMLYPDPEMEKNNDGRYTRFIATTDLKNTLENVYGDDLDWFFNVYLHQPYLPQLVTNLQEDTLIIFWKTPQNLPFKMPIDIKIGKNIKRYEINNSPFKVKIEKKDTIQIDPLAWGLFELAAVSDATECLRKNQYSEAARLYKTALMLAPENKMAQKMIKHVRYVLENKDKIEGTFFGGMLVNYLSSSGLNYSFTKQEKQFFMKTDRGEYKMYPVSDSTFIFTDYPGRVIFNSDPQQKHKQVLLEMGSRKIHAVEMID
jgi:aminopeptidase N